MEDARLSLKVRQRLKLTQEELGKMLHAHVVTVSRWENGHYTLSGWRRNMLELMFNSKASAISETLKKEGAFRALSRAVNS